MTEKISDLTFWQITALAGLFFFAPFSVPGMNVCGALFVLLSAARALRVPLRHDTRPLVATTLALAAWIALTGLWAPSAAAAGMTARALWWYLILPLGALAVDWRESHLKTVVRVFIVGNVLNALLFVAQLSNLFHAFTYDARFGLVGLGNRVYLSMLVPPIIVLLIEDLKHKYFVRQRTLALGIIALLVFEVMWSSGRTTQIMLPLVAAGFYWRAIRRNWRVALAALLLFGAAAWASPNFTTRWLEARHDVVHYLDGNASTDFGVRLTFWKASVLAVLDHPLAGLGAGGFTPEFHALMDAGRIPRIDASWWWSIEPHNSYLAVAAEYGLIGLALFLGFGVMCLRDAQAARCPHLRDFKLLMLGTFALASFSDSFVWRWQGMMLLLAVFAIRDPIEAPRHV